jgi:Tol biopolymer transport system component
MKLMRVAATGGSPEFVLDMFHPEDWRCSNARSNVCVIGETSKDGKQFVITAFDPLKGRGKVLRIVDRAATYIKYGTALSPDGVTFAFAKSGDEETQIRLISLNGGVDREIRSKACRQLTGLDWSIDGNGLYCGSLSSQGGVLSYVDLNGNPQVLWQHRGAVGFSDAIYAIPSPDGHYLAIHGGRVTSNVWMVQGF